MIKTFTLTFTLLTAAISSYAATTITFSDGSDFDQEGVGASMALVDGSFNFSLTTVDIVGTDGLSVLNDGATHVTSISGAGGFGVNSTSPEVSSTNFDGGESWTAVFDQSVTLSSIGVLSLGSGDIFTFVILDGSNGGAGNSIALSDGLNNLNVDIDANTQFRIETAAESGSVRFDSITVTATAIPEPSAVALTIGCMALATSFISRRKRA